MSYLFSLFLLTIFSNDLMLLAANKVSRIYNKAADYTNPKGKKIPVEKVTKGFESKEEIFNFEHDLWEY